LGLLYRPAWAEKVIDQWCTVAQRMDIRNWLPCQRLRRYKYGILSHCRHSMHTSGIEGVTIKSRLSNGGLRFPDRILCPEVKQAFPGHVLTLIWRRTELRIELAPYKAASWFVALCLTARLRLWPTPRRARRQGPRDYYFGNCMPSQNGPRPIRSPSRGFVWRISFVRHDYREILPTSSLAQ